MTPPSRMVRKFLNDTGSKDTSMKNETASDCSPENGWPQGPYEEHCFFYGTSMDPHTLSQVLNLSKPPVMRRARVAGHEIKLWGQYPALLGGKPGHSVHGVVSELLTRPQLDRLAAYETDKYRLTACYIEILNDDDSIEKTIEGACFKWDGQDDELREGAFDLKQWKKDQQLQGLD
ncbi:uncharacterized protein N7529_010851 [Penicillium soppii]|uniref:uncharacterized protein n=1 Tax=Penicillium soppii TaxID=69789 RepID=UPI0025490082|nr:uncharacterized protein N7529_010851 [Penicillium soppii]KAJ5851466.1 hypothetical protein N7529_010851 [Penicillium soppii]